MVTGKYDDPVLALLCFDEGVSGGFFTKPESTFTESCKDFCFLF